MSHAGRHLRSVLCAARSCVASSKSVCKQGFLLAPDTNCLANGNFLSSGMRRSRTAAVGITHALTSLRANFQGFPFYFARIHSFLAAPRQCAACGHEIAAEKGDFLVRRARTAHHAGAHNARLTPISQRVGKLGRAAQKRGFACAMIIAKGYSCLP